MPSLKKLFIGACLLVMSIFSAEAESGWFPFAPAPDPFNESAIDLRRLNEKFAGEHGFIAARGADFVFTGNQEPVRFWAVNGPPHELQGPALKTAARRLAKYGVNLCRLHGGMFDAAGNLDAKKVAHAQEMVEALRAEGIYTHFSIYFPLWIDPKPENAFLKGYDGHTHPFAALLFNPDFQKQYREWWRGLLTTPNAAGKKLVDDPAVFGVEIQNEDSFFFWTFDINRIPDAQARLLESQFGEWLAKKYGSIDGALAKWDGVKIARDNPAEGRVSFRPLWALFSEKKQRDKDTVAFLFEVQRKFYADTYAYLRSLGFKGVITASNWSTASPEVFGPLEKLSYCATDFVDRHGYFGITHKGDSSEWSIRNGHTYSDRSALRFEAVTPGKPREFVHPAMDPTYNDKPSMISETTWNRPNRFRSEAPAYFAVYGALQGTDAIVHFAYDGDAWSVKPNYFMQPWTLMAPSQMAQFPATALIYRRGLVKTGAALAKVNLNMHDLLNLQGTPLPQDANLDELRLKDVPAGGELKPGQRIDPLIHYVGRAEVSFSDAPSKTELKDLSALIDHAKQRVRSSTGELELDYGKGLLKMNAPGAQGVSGDLRGESIALRDVTIQSDLDNGHILVVALDDQPLDQSKRMLLQIMSEEKASGFQAEAATNGLKKIVDIGRDPWLIKDLQARITLKKAAQFQRLDFNGYPVGEKQTGNNIEAPRDAIYLLLTR